MCYEMSHYSNGTGLVDLQLRIPYEYHVGVSAGIGVKKNSSYTRRNIVVGSTNNKETAVRSPRQIINLLRCFCFIKVTLSSKN